MASRHTTTGSATAAAKPSSPTTFALRGARRCLLRATTKPYVARPLAASAFDHAREGNPPTMRYTRLGATDLDVSRVCFGTWQFGGDWGGIEKDEAAGAVRRARELGINIFDTAQAYGWGASERLLGEALRDDIQHRRDEVILATKGGVRSDGGQRLRDSSEAWLRQGLEESLRNLGIDHIDIYQVHWPDQKVPIEETAGVLDTFVHEGKIRYAGVSNYSVEQMEAFERRRKLDTLQPPYHLFRRDIERDVLPWCREHGVGVLAYGPLAHG